MEDNTYYDILEIKKSDDQSTIKKAWYRLSQKYHPDKAQDKLHGDKMMKEINEAYNVLSDPEKRSIYDKFGKKGLEEGHTFNGDPFSQMFPGMFSRQQKDLVPPIKISVKLTLDKLYTGTSVEKEFKRRDICKICDRTGTKDKKKNPCNQCGGRGHIPELIRRGPIVQQVNSKCPTCDGKCINPEAELCEQCNGEIFEIKTSTIKYEIPPGYCGGSTIEIPNEGDEIPVEYRVPDRTRGRLLLIIEEEEHEIFKRTNNNESDLLIKLRISLADTLCGFKKIITHLDGRKLAIMSNDTIDGNSKVIKSEGMPKISNPLLRGNLIVQFQIVMPEKLTSEQKQKLYLCLTGQSLDDVDFSVSDDDIITHMSNFSENDVDEESYEENNQDRSNVPQCHMQ